MKITNDLKTEFHEEIEILKRAQAEMKVKLEDSVFQLEYSGESLANWMSQAEDRAPEFKDKSLTLDQIVKENERILNHDIQTCKKCRIPQEESDIDYVFNNVTEENISKLKKDVPIQLQETHRFLS